LEAVALGQMFHFGKWVFLSTIAGFLVNQGDRAILGLYVSLQDLGIYNIGYFLASVPLLLSFALQQTVMMPLYRMKPPSESATNRAALNKARRLIALLMLTVAGILAFIGPPLVAFLYDGRYASAGAMIPLFCISTVPAITLNTITAALIGVGDTKGSFFVIGITATLQIALLIFLISEFGILGAIFSPGIAVILSYPVRLFYSLKYEIFDLTQDLGITLIGAAPPLVACILYWAEIRSLFNI